jgi:hypothetical protein
MHSQSEVGSRGALRGSGTAGSQIIEESGGSNPTAICCFNSDRESVALSHAAFFAGRVQSRNASAYREAYMRAAGWAAGKSATVAHLAPSAPDEQVGNRCRVVGKLGEDVGEQSMRIDVLIVQIAAAERQLSLKWRSSGASSWSSRCPVAVRAMPCDPAMCRWLARASPWLPNSARAKTPLAPPILRVRRDDLLDEAAIAASNR